MRQVSCELSYIRILYCYFTLRGGTERKKKNCRRAKPALLASEPRDERCRSTLDTLAQRPGARLATSRTFCDPRCVGDVSTNPAFVDLQQ